MFSCIILSAGLSTRFGSPKALASIDHQLAINVILAKLHSTPCDDIIVVLGAHATLIEQQVLNHKNIRIVYNKDYLLGQTSSFKTGLNAVSSSSKGALLWPVDCPFIDPSTITHLLTHFSKYQSPITIPTYHHKRGHPPLFAQHLFQTLLNWPIDKGINDFYHTNPHLINEVPVDDPGSRLTFNSPTELASILKKR